MKTTLKLLAVATALSTLWGGAIAQNRSTPQTPRGPAETNLVGIALFDPGHKVIARFGNPSEIQPLAVGAGGGAGGGTTGGGRSGPGGGAGGPKGGGGGGAAAASNDWIGDPFGTGKTYFQEQGGPAAAGSTAPGGTGAQDPGEQGQRGGGGSVGGGSSVGGSTQGSGSMVNFTRWVYNRPGSRYAFVLDKFNRVVQIEAIGLYDSRVKTRRGVKFGSTFGSVINKYNAPDGYEISGDTIVVRYLTRHRVAFKLQRVDAKKPHMVTGVVVAAGK